MSSKKLRVVIVGAGFGGLTTAIECQLRGMQAVLIEKHPTSKNYGDVIDFFPNGGRIIEKWDNGRIAEQLLAMCINQGEKFEFYRHDGLFLASEPWNAKPHHYSRQLAGHRGEMHHTVIDYATRLGVEMRFGETVVQYLDKDSELGVVTKSGQKILGDVVVAADGPRSLARQAVLNLPDIKINSGYAIYRAFYTLTDEHRKNRLLAPLSNPDKDITKMWVGHDMHALVYVWNKGRDLGWVLTHKDDHAIGESWSFPGKKEDVLNYLEEGKFEELFHEIVRETPESQLVDYKLVWREPLKTWLAPSARTVVIGDAAHCHLPSSGQGGAQSLEDGVTLAVCLDRAKGDVQLGLRVFERVRFNRSHAIHMSSISNRDEYHTIEWTKEFVDENPGILTIPRPDWIMEFDAEANAEANFDQLAADVKTGRQGTIEELALPAGGSFDKSTWVQKSPDENVVLTATLAGPSVLVAVS